MPRRAASRASSGHDQGGSVPLGLDRQPAGRRRLHLGGLQRCERGGTAAALTVSEPRQARLGEPATPAAHGVQMQRRLPGDACVGASTHGVQHHLCTHPQPVLVLVTVGHLLQPHAFGGTRDYRTAGADGHGGRTDRLKWITGTRGRPAPARHLPSPSPSPSPRNDRYKRPLGQGKRNFDMARGGSYLHLVFGDRPRSHRSSFRLSRPRRDELVMPHEPSPPYECHRTGPTPGSPNQEETHAPSCSVHIRRPEVTSR